MFPGTLTAALWAALRLDLLLLNVLAVAGGAAVGGLGVGFLARLGGRMVGARRVPRGPLAVLRLLGAGVVALAVWLWAFGTGGSGWQPGGGGSAFGGKGAGEGEAQVVTTSEVKPSRATTPVPAQGDTVRVIMLGGERVKDGRFYRVEGESDAKTFEQLKADLKERQKKGPLRTVVILVYQDSVARNHPTVHDLTDWAWQNKLTPIIPPSLSGSAP